jgi:NADH-quinone oxidoreductase subunit H
MNILTTLFYIAIFPGFLFLFFFALAAQYMDRKFYARLQNRIGPPWFQALADFIKLVSKEEILPEDSEKGMFKAVPIVALVAVVTAFLYIPFIKPGSPFPFDGDLIVIVYLLTIPTFCYFLGGWFSTSIYAMLGSIRSLNQLFAYEVPLLLSVLSPALLANSWSLTEIISFYKIHPLLWPLNMIAFFVAMIALQGKLERVPFDIPEAETEIVAGTFTEYSGRYYAFFRLAIDIEMVVGAAFLAAIFMPFGFSGNIYTIFLFSMGKIILIILALSVFRSIFARMRIDQMMNFCWKYLLPLSLLQIIIVLLFKEFFLI